jgi:hypothetical protein
MSNKATYNLFKVARKLDVDRSYKPDVDPFGDRFDDVDNPFDDGETVPGISDDTVSLDPKEVNQIFGLGAGSLGDENDPFVSTPEGEETSYDVFQDLNMLDETFEEDYSEIPSVAQDYFQKYDTEENPESEETFESEYPKIASVQNYLNRYKTK